ncbi:hypothetical protein EUX98_g9135 [Antrodiella citrinella]|uniref:Nitrogen regulatory protein areA GATA-like domain-containing protein n=1 Tax=Antrodiella citrinella TaxID=2447956 RepID=A0A4S4LXS2_9APHY|nr:hypothetical protein EUX98_g9135 [Antrodiella citrinella]
MPVTATITSYLPTLLASVSNTTAPDDSTLSNLAQGQVDYLSHEWREEDVWQSWRNMTRQKNAIANGMRLENASWRTWWKQRNKLKTISPETLNWLKDSDVTWLYGPLHVGSDWTKYTTHKPSHGRKNSVDEASCTRMIGHPSSPNLMGKKPILKRRSITQLLSLPASPFFDQEDSDENDETEEEQELMRPPLMHTKSDTHISWRSRPYRKNSPPRITAADLQQYQAPTQSSTPAAEVMTVRSMTNSSDASNSTGSEQDLSAGSSNGVDPVSKKKHISFNTFVEQCIAIEKPKSKRRKSFVGTRSSSLGFFPHSSGYDDGYDEDSEVGYEYESDEPSSFYVGDRAGMGSDSEDEDDDVLEMRTSSSRSRSSSSSRSRQSPLAHSHDPPSTSPQPSSSVYGARPPIVRQGSMDRDRVTIAPIAPTILKTIGVGNNLSSSHHEGRNHVPKEVDLVYVPPSNSIYSLPSTPSNGHEDIYHYQESYFTLGGPSTVASRHSLLTHNSYIGPSHSHNDYPTASSSRQYPSSPHPVFNHHQYTESPQMIMEEPAAHPDAYDYFGGPDLGEDFGERGAEQRRHHTRRRRSYSDAGNDDLVGLHDGSGMLRYAHGGAASVTMGRSSSLSGDHIWPGVVGAQVGTSPRHSSEVPSVIVNEVTGAMEERTERSPMSTSPVSRSPPTAPTVIPIAIKTTPVHDASSISFSHSISNPSPVSRIIGGTPSAYPRRQDSDPAYLSPPDAALSGRGRSPQRSSHSGSTTTGSYSHSSDSRSESRGRSSTRTSSFSDHERSGSRSSRGTNSPLGSISPTGSNTMAAGGRGRDRERDKSGESRIIRKPVEGGEEERRGRDRSGRRLGESMSPPSLVGSPARKPTELVDYQPYTPELLGAHLEKMDRDQKDQAQAQGTTSPPSSISGSSTASSTTIGPHDVAERVTRRPSVSSIPIPEPIPEEEELTRSRQSTPANSPTTALALHPSVLPIPVPPILQTQSSLSPQFARAPKSPPVLPVTSPSEATATATTCPPLSPTNLQRSSERVVKGLPEEAQQTGTLVGRAAEIVSSARGFLGSIWAGGVAGTN